MTRFQRTDWMDVQSISSTYLIVDLDHSHPLKVLLQPQLLYVQVYL